MGTVTVIPNEVNEGWAACYHGGRMENQDLPVHRTSFIFFPNNCTILYKLNNAYNYSDVQCAACSSCFTRRGRTGLGEPVTAVLCLKSQQI